MTLYLCDKIPVVLCFIKKTLEDRVRSFLKGKIFQCQLTDAIHLKFNIETLMKLAQLTQFHFLAYQRGSIVKRQLNRAICFHVHVPISQKKYKYINVNIYVSIYIYVCILLCVRKHLSLNFPCSTSLFFVRFSFESYRYDPKPFLMPSAVQRPNGKSSRL